MAIRLTESRLRQIIREEASKLTQRPSRGTRRRLRENADPKFQEYLEEILANADQGEFFADSATLAMAKNYVEDTLVYDFDDVDMTPELVDGLTQALLKMHKELRDEGYDSLGGGESNDDSSYPNF